MNIHRYYTLFISHSNGEESLSDDNADDESDAENGSDIEVPVVSDDEVDDNDLTVAEDDDQIEDADTVIWSEVFLQ
jgi:hypothetical protein